MILITKQESEVIRARYPKADIVRTCIQKSKRHKYYMPERVCFLNLIKDTNAKAAEIFNEKKNQREFSY